MRTQLRSSLAGVLGIEVSLMQSGMGGVAGPELACAVSNAGGAGCVGGYKLTGPQLSTMLERLLAGTERPVGVNFIPEVVGAPALAEQVDQLLAQTPQRVYVSFFGMPEDTVAERVTAAGRALAIQVGTVADGVHAAALGAVVIAQGVEAGGHLLGHSGRDELLTQLRAELPDSCLVAAGGIGSVDEARRAVAAGADGVLLGTPFVVAHESMAHEVFKGKVVDAGAADTVITDVYEIGWAGRRHRALVTAATADPSLPSTFIGKTTVEGRNYLVPRFSAAVPTVATTGRIEEMAMYCGTSCQSISGRAPAADIVAAFAPVLP